MDAESMNHGHIILSNFPSLTSTLTCIEGKDKSLNDKEFRYMGFVKKEEYPVLLDNSIEKFFISLLLYETIYLNDKDFLKIIQSIGVLNSVKLLERKVIKIIPRHQDPNVIVHRSKNPLVAKTWYELEPIMYLGALHELDKNYKKFSVNESLKARIVQYFENAHVSLDNRDETLFFKNIEFLKAEEKLNFHNLDYQDTFRALRLYEVIDSFLLQDKYHLSNSLIDDYGQSYLSSKLLFPKSFQMSEKKLELFEDISIKKKIPNFHYMLKRGSLTFDTFLDIRESFHSKLFRTWFLNPEIENNDIYYELLKNYKISGYMNIMKWVVPTIIGVLNTPLGIVSSAIENFFISKILEGWNPNLFLDDILSKKLNALEKKFDLEQERRIIVDRFKGIQRNDLCPCQSGKKFKKCHGANI